MEEWPDLFRQEVLNKWCDPTVGRCELKPLKPVLRVQGFSAETKIPDTINCFKVVLSISACAPT